MVKTVDAYKRLITKALKSSGRYSSALEIQITALASAIRTLELACAEIDGLTTTTVLEKTRYGEKLAPNPVFKVQKDAQDSVTRQMKALGLTAEALMGEIEHDPLVELTERLQADEVSPQIDPERIIKPKGTRVGKASKVKKV